MFDEAYPNLPQELSPFRGKKLTQEQDAFNYYLSVHRQVVERAFGLLVARFGVFWRPLQVSFDRIPLLISACCRLHNLCVRRFGITTAGVACGDCQPGVDAEARYTDGTGMFKERRTDLEETNTRSWLVRRLKAMGKVRPTHSIMHQKKTRA